MIFLDLDEAKSVRFSQRTNNENRCVVHVHDAMALATYVSRALVLKDPVSATESSIIRRLYNKNHFACFHLQDPEMKRECRVAAEALRDAFYDTPSACSSRSRGSSSRAPSTSSSRSRNADGTRGLFR